MLTRFRLIGILLALPLLAATSTADLLPADASFASLHNFSVAEAKFGSTPARTASSPAKHELEDGPEGEDTPIANLVRAYDGDDQIETQFGFVTIVFRTVALIPTFAGTPPAQHYFPCAGFPTGPPIA